MFVRTDHDKISVESFGGGVGETFSTSHTSKPIQMESRIMRGEPIYFEDRFYDYPCRLESPFRKAAVFGQVCSLPLMCEKFQAEPAEMKIAIREGMLPEDAGLKARTNLEYFDGVNYDIGRSLYFSWRQISKVLGWLTMSPAAASVPYTATARISVGFPTFDQDRIPEYDALRPSSGVAEAREAFDAFAEHVFIAATCALDSPQLVTVGDAYASNLIRFRNTRLSPGLRGLLISLPTGGVHFLRDARYDLSFGAIRIRQGSLGDASARIGKKALALRILRDCAMDFAWMANFAERFHLDYPAALKAWKIWPTHAKTL